MTRQTIATGTSPNDGTGDTLRQAAQKINENFAEIYFAFGDGNIFSTKISLEDSAIAFEGQNFDNFETRLTVEEPTADRIIQLPDASGDIVLGDNTQTLTNKTLTSARILTPKITTDIFDSNDNEIIKLTSTFDAVNEITISNSLSGNAPRVSATGGDANINLSLLSKGTGSVNVDKLSLTAITMNNDGNADTTASYIICDKLTLLNITLTNGTAVGEMKVFTNKNTGTAVITPTNFAQGSLVSLDQYDTVTLIWDGANWYVVGQSGAAIS